jgi:hypothetical protein
VKLSLGNEYEKNFTLRAVPIELFGDERIISTTFPSARERGRERRIHLPSSPSIVTQAAIIIFYALTWDCWLHLASGGERGMQYSLPLLYRRGEVFANFFPSHRIFPIDNDFILNSCKFRTPGENLFEFIPAQGSNHYNKFSL